MYISSSIFFSIRRLVFCLQIDFAKKNLADVNYEEVKEKMMSVYGEITMDGEIEELPASAVSNLACVVKKKII